MSRWCAFWDAYIELFDITGKRTYRKWRRRMNQRGVGGGDHE